MCFAHASFAPFDSHLIFSRGDEESLKKLSNGVAHFLTLRRGRGVLARTLYYNVAAARVTVGRMTRLRNSNGRRAGYIFLAHHHGRRECFQAATAASGKG